MDKANKRDRGDGWLYQRGSRWWIAYSVQGERKRESGGKTEDQARAKLKRRLKEIAAREYVGPKQERLKVTDLLDALELNLEVRGLSSLRTYRSHALPLREFFGGTLSLNLKPHDCERYIKARMAEGLSAGTINNELIVLRQSYSHAAKQGRISKAHVPYVSRVRNDGRARQGFFELAEFEAVVANLPSPIDDIARFAYATGWRKGEVLPLRWDAVDRTAKEIRLRTSKNGHGRVLPLDDNLWQLIERRWDARLVLGVDGVTRVSEYVFNHSGHYGGKPRFYINIDKSWREATKKAGVPGKLFHDFRRTAARDMVRAGTPETVAMAITGHKTRSMFDRYNITSTADLENALTRTVEYRKTVPATASKVTPFPVSGNAAK